MEHGHLVQVVAVANGKGRVGKTAVAINLSLALPELGRRVILLEADPGLPNIGVLLGLTSKYTLVDLIESRCPLSDVRCTSARSWRGDHCSVGIRYAEFVAFVVYAVRVFLVRLVGRSKG